uniref:MGA conserved domain-containing protein n=1 Tax=Dendroctonus ponderosae TaxID=77166 RepID=A0AAR5PX19_DENPD
MRFRKTISGLNASPSQIKRKLKHMKPPGYNMELDEMLVLATMKMSPIIDLLMDAPKSPVHFIKLSECDDIEQVMDIVRDVTKALENIGFQMDIQMVNFDMDKYRERANCDRQVYVDTSLLLGILELHNILENLKADLDGFYRSIGIHSFVQTESLSSASSCNPNKIVFKLNPKLQADSNDSSSLGFFKKNFLVMPSMTQIVPLAESRSQILMQSATHQYSSVKKSKSEIFMDDEEITGVTDVYGARKILVKCIYDLKGVSDYLATPRVDASTIVSNASEASQRFFVPSQEKGHFYVPSQEEAAKFSPAPRARGPDGCCCKDCFGLDEGATIPECDEDQVIICIKGCNKEEGDVQIVIRQCPDCKANTEGAVTTTKSPTANFLPVSTETPLITESPPVADAIKSEEAILSDSSVNDNSEPIVLHNKDSKGSVVCSEEEEEEAEKEEKEGGKSSRRSTLRSYVQNQLSCSRIKMCETTNLCFETETGQELVISLTVTPKELVGEKLSLGDIFSDSEGASEPVNSSQKAPASKTNAQPARQRVAYFVPDRYIPLGRTKICSSLDFDVTTAASKIRSHGMKNRNNKIVVQLQDFGTDNLLRACRPAKCCRKAILNEKMKKCLPYAASLRSLPLDEDDFSVINESLQMSLQKVKNSTDLNKDFTANQRFVLNPMHTVLYFFFEADLRQDELREICQRKLVELKLAFYIHLASDLPPPCQYFIQYFGVEKGQAQPSENFSKWMRRSYEDRPISPMGLVVEHKSRLSRIPVYRRPKALASLEPQEAPASVEPNIFLASLSSLPRTPGLEGELGLRKTPQESTGTSSPIHSIEAIGNSRLSSKCSIGGTLKRGKRKKKEFYLSKSLSEISLNIQSKPNCQRQQLSLTASLEAPKGSKSKDHQSKIILNYFSKMLFEMVKKQMAREQLVINAAVHVVVGTENKSLLKIYRKPAKSLRKSYHELNAKQSQYCLVVANSDILKSISLQTSKQLKDCKKCQTSNTLLDCCQKKQIFKRCFNCEQSCDEIENFVVTFNSDQSCESTRTCDSDQEDSLRQSLVRLKETLEQYESLKTEIAQLPQNNFINPIEYFVYHQVCACNPRVSKKPSMMQKILSKTNELFCSPEKDMSRKYNNQRAAFSLSSTDKDQCHSCSCKISTCTGQSAQLLCSCPEETGAEQPRSFLACCQKFKHKSSLSKLALASALSVKSLKSRLKLSKPAQRSCSCVAEPDSEKLTMCISGNIEVVKCDRVSAATSTMRDSATQKCTCGQCQKFADDGTCCCSHCLGCLDKSFDAKPANQSVSVETEAVADAESILSPQSPASMAVSNTYSAGIVIMDPEESKKSLERSSFLDPQFASGSNDLNNLDGIQSGLSQQRAVEETVEAQISGSNETTASYFVVTSPPQLLHQLLNFQQLLQVKAREGRFNP